MIISKYSRQTTLEEIAEKGEITFRKQFWPVATFFTRHCMYGFSLPKYTSVNHI